MKTFDKCDHRGFRGSTDGRSTSKSAQAASDNAVVLGGASHNADVAELAN
jgi:hypothetical protein